MLVVPRGLPDAVVVRPHRDHGPVDRCYRAEPADELVADVGAAGRVRALGSLRTADEHKVARAEVEARRAPEGLAPRKEPCSEQGRISSSTGLARPP